MLSIADWHPPAGPLNVYSLYSGKHTVRTKCEGVVRSENKDELYHPLDPPASPDPLTRVRGRTLADAADLYHRLRVVEVLRRSRGRRRGTPAEGKAEATAPYSLRAVVAVSPAGAGSDSDGVVSELDAVLQETALQL